MTEPTRRSSLRDRVRGISEEERKQHVRDVNAIMPHVSPTISIQFDRIREIIKLYEHKKLANDAFENAVMNLAPEAVNVLRNLYPHVLDGDNGDR